MTLPYTLEESEAASAGWKATCGHHSIAAATGRTLDAVKAACPKLCGWMSPTMVTATLNGLGLRIVLERPARHNQDRVAILRAHPAQILRIQFEGSWLNPGVPVGAAYQRTHYIAVCQGRIMDTMIHAMMLINAPAWLLGETGAVLAQIPKATGWHFTHAWPIPAVP